MVARSIIAAGRRAAAGGGAILALNFRATAGYVTDGPDEYPMLGEAYQHQYAPGVVAGLSSGSLNQRDRHATYDRRLAGWAFKAQSIEPYILIDLPAAGTYRCSCALGDPLITAAVNGPWLKILNEDDSVVFDWGNTVTLTSGQVSDIDETIYDAATADPDTFATQDLVFTGTVAKWNSRDRTTGGNNGFAYIRMEQL